MFCIEIYRITIMQDNVPTLDIHVMQISFLTRDQFILLYRINNKIDNTSSICIAYKYKDFTKLINT